MMHNRFLAKCGVSLACLVSVWGMGAYAKTTELFRFPVDIPAGANGTDGCSPKVTAGSNGCTEITERTLVSGACQDTTTVRTVCPGEQGPQGAGCVTKSLTTNTDSQTLVLTCGTGSNAEDTTITIPNGQGCAVSRVDTTATGKNIIMACGNSSTTISVENGTNCNLTVATDSTTRNVSVTKSCGNETPTTVEILNHQNLVNDAATATANKIIQDGTFATAQQLSTANSDISALQSGKLDVTTHNAFVTSTNTALAGKVDTSALNDYYNKTEMDTTVAGLQQDIIAASSGLTSDQVDTMIHNAIAGNYYTKTDADEKFATASGLSSLQSTVTTVQTTANGAVQKDQLATELGKTANTNAINSIINSNLTVTGLQSTLSTVQTTANNALPKNQLATEVGKLGYASASDLSSLQSTVAGKANASDVYTKGEIDNQMATLATKEELASATMCNGQIETHSNGNKIEVVCVEN